MTDVPHIKSAPATANRQRWLITFTDLMALLLAFFVMLYAMSIVDPEPWENMTNSMVSRLNPDFGWDSLSSLSDLDADSTATAAAADLDYLQVVIADKFRGVPLLSQALLTRHADRLVISLQADSLFAAGSASLAEGARAALLALGDTLRHISNRVDVHGHTDPNPVRGGQYASNWELSVFRALAVAEALASAGYTREIAAIGFAESRFDERAAVDDQETRFRHARRVDVIIRDIQSTGGDQGGGDHGGGDHGM